MAARQVSPQHSNHSPRRPATTPEAREHQLVAAAIDLAERQILEGTASAQVITHFLKLGSTREHVEQELLSERVASEKAKREALASQARVEEMYTEAMDAFRSYSGRPSVRSDEDEDYDYDD